MLVLLLAAPCIRRLHAAACPPPPLPPTVSCCPCSQPAPAHSHTTSDHLSLQLQEPARMRSAALLSLLVAAAAVGAVSANHGGQPLPLALHGEALCDDTAPFIVNVLGEQEGKLRSATL